MNKIIKRNLLKNMNNMIKKNLLKNKINLIIRSLLLRSLIILKANKHNKNPILMIFLHLILEYLLKRNSNNWMILQIKVVSQNNKYKNSLNEQTLHQRKNGILILVLNNKDKKEVT